MESHITREMERYLDRLPRGRNASILINIADDRHWIASIMIKRLCGPDGQGMGYITANGTGETPDEAFKAARAVFEEEAGKDARQFLDQKKALPSHAG